MAKKIINKGLVPNDGTGDKIRDAIGKVNDNFTELYDDKENTEDGTTSFKKGNIPEGDFTEIKEDGTLRSHGGATTYEDLRIPTSSTKSGGSKQPTFAKLKDDGSGSQGVFVEWFDKTLEEELYFDVQLPHAWKEGTNIFPHVHWTPKSTGVNGGFVKWGLEYTWSNVNDLYGDTNIIYSDATSSETATVSGDSIMTEGKHHISRLGDGIDATGKSISSMLVCRVFRVATDSDDTYDDDAGLLEIDFHYEVDSLGSDEEFTKA